VELDTILNEHEAAERLRIIDVKTLRNWRSQSRRLKRQIGPKFVKLGGRVGYRLSSLRQYLLLNESN
jgi:hypothetical protein